MNIFYIFLSFALFASPLAAKKKLKKAKTKKSDYVYEYNYNVRVQNAPLLLLALFEKNYTFGVEGLFYLNRNFSIGPVLNYFATGSGEDQDEERDRLGSVNFGVRTDFYFFDHGYTQDTIYISNALLYGLYNFESYSVDFDVQGCNRSYKSSGGALIGSLIVGYQWMFDSGINIAAGVGGLLTRNLDRSEEFTSQCDLEKFKKEVTYEPYRGAWFDLTIGYAF